MSLDLFLLADVWAALLTLTVLEIILGIDNIIIISILTDRLPEHRQPFARKVGLGTALITRVLLLSLAFWVAHLEVTVFTIFNEDISWRDLLLVAGGLFLIAKGTTEIHGKIESSGEEKKNLKKTTAFALIIAQIAVLDIVFSFDSVMTAIGVADHLIVMIIAIVISMIVMILTIDHISAFISRHPTIKILALSYLLLIGIALVADGMDVHIPKEYLYFAMAFSFFVELVNMAIRRNKRKSASE